MSSNDDYKEADAAAAGPQKLHHQTIQVMRTSPYRRKLTRQIVVDVESSGGKLEKKVRAHKGRRPMNRDHGHELDACAFNEPADRIHHPDQALADNKLEDQTKGWKKFSHRHKHSSSSNNQTRCAKRCSLNSRTSAIRFQANYLRKALFLLTTLVIFITQDFDVYFAKLKRIGSNSESMVSGRSDSSIRVVGLFAGVQCTNSIYENLTNLAEASQSQQGSVKQQLSNNPKKLMQHMSNNVKSPKIGGKSAPKTKTENSSSTTKVVSERKAKTPNKALHRAPHSRSSSDPDDSSAQDDNVEEQQLQISITPRVGQIRVPVDSNAMLKCLISSSSGMGGNKLSQKFNIQWSRYMYDENVYEHLDTNPLVRSQKDDSSSSDNHAKRSGSSQSEEVLLGKVPFDRQQQLRDFLDRSRQETNIISDLLTEATLSISPVKASDNASYYCTAIDGKFIEQNQARIDLVALSRPVVQLERVFPARDSKSAIIHWLVLSDGNTPIKKTILMVRNDTNGATFNSRPLPPGLQETLITSSSADSNDFEQPSTTSQYSSMVIDSNYNQWQRIDIPDDKLDIEPAVDSLFKSPYDHSSQVSSSAGADVDVTSPLNSGSSNSQQQQQQQSSDQDYYTTSRVRWSSIRTNKRRQRSYNLTSLLPGVTYNFRLAAINDMGQSEWSYLTATMPNEIPAQISEMFLLSRSNDSLAIGWRRPAYDGAKTIRYEMQLFDLNRTLTLDANTNTSANSQKTNFMYIFVNLNPGTDYQFHVRACSRAGCSAYSSPRLLASTLDGEPDEPLEVELSCEPESGNVSVSWLPPASPRGLLLNYSVSFDSRARYRNQSGYWQVDEWRSSMETADNQTLNLEAAGILLPNTNYTVRVCANNRSKHCGRMSQLTSRSQCSTPPELPGELPRGIQLKRQTVASQNDQAPVDNKQEYLELELPFISSRNGTLSCIQIVLVRLPGSYKSGTTSLRKFLPEHPGDVTLSRFAPASTNAQELVASLRVNDGETAKIEVDEQAQAYLAEEVDPSAMFGGENSFDQQVTSQQTPVHRISLGDGKHDQCRMRQSEPIARPAIFDGPLKARAFYTGFVKLILVRPSLSGTKYPPAATNQKRAAASDAQVEILTKFSGYLEPVQMGDNVIELSGSRMLNSPDVHLSTPFAVETSLDKLRPLQEMATELGSSLKKNLGKFYNYTSNYVADNLRLESLGDYIRKSSPLVQFLELGIIVIVISLLLLLIVYLLTLPTTLARRRKRKIKRQLHKHQQDAAQLNNMNQQQFSLGHFDNKSPSDGNLGQAVFDSVPVPSPEHPEGQQQPSGEYQPLMASCADQQSALSPIMNEQKFPQHQHQHQHQHLHQHQHQHQQHQQQQQIYRQIAPNRECPIHSSPANSNNSGGRAPILQHHEHRPATVHVCQPMIAYDHRAGANDDQYRKQQQHHHHDPPMSRHQKQEQYERNCRTTRRQQFATEADLQALSAKNCLTLSHQQQLNNSALALAKKINKSIPLRLFRAVLEHRLRNGWLKEEYEQLPNPLVPNDLGQKVQPQATVMKLRPQLIVSRNDTMSALISGDDQYDAGLVSFGGSSSINNGSSAATGAISTAGRRIICAKSPLDADSVWDFWRLVYEQDVSTIVMLTQNEDANTGELRCASYWPTCESEETTILSPCNEFVQKSSILPAKFKIRQETLEKETAQDGFMVRRLTLIVMATKPGENVQQDANDSVDTTSDDGSKKDNDDPDDEEENVIIQRDILQLQFHCWNTSTVANQLRLITFIRRANERHLISLKQQQMNLEVEGLISPHRNADNPMLVHCFNGLGRSGVFAGLSFVLDDLASKLNLERQQNELQKLNIFQIVSKMRIQREMIISPYRFYELLYLLVANCIPQDMML